LLLQLLRVMINNSVKMQVNQQDPDAGNSRVAMSAGAKKRFRALPVIGEARRWLGLTGKARHFISVLK